MLFTHNHPQVENVKGYLLCFVFFADALKMNQLVLSGKNQVRFSDSEIISQKIILLYDTYIKPPFLIFNLQRFVYFQRVMKYLILSALALALGETTMVQNRPDAIRCGPPVGGGSVFIQTYGSEYDDTWYCQVWADQRRCVVFNPDGSFQTGFGDYGQREYCVNKSLAQLKEQGRTFQFTSGPEINVENTEIESEKEEDERELREESEIDEEASQQHKSSQSFGVDNILEYEELKKEKIMNEADKKYQAKADDQ